MPPSSSQRYTRGAVVFAAATLAMLLNGCGGDAGTATSTVTSASPPAGQALSAEPAAPPESIEPAPAVPVGTFDPPRPTGVPDSDWADLLQAWDPAVSAEILATLGSGTDPDAVAEWCGWDEETLRQETMDGAAQSAADNYPESTLDEWNAFFEAFIADLDALRQERCANSQ